MKVLIDNFNNGIFEAGMIEKGIFPEVDPETELYKVTNDKGSFYAVANGFKEVEVKELPTEHDYHEYTYEDGQFIWHEPPKTVEQLLTEIQQQLKEQAEQTKELTYISKALGDDVIEIVKKEQMSAGNYTNPIKYESGMIVEKDLWYYLDDKDLPKEAIKSGKPSSFEDETFLV